MPCVSQVTSVLPTCPLALTHPTLDVSHQGLHHQVLQPVGVQALQARCLLLQPYCSSMRSSLSLNQRCYQSLWTEQYLRLSCQQMVLLLLVSMMSGAVFNVTHQPWCKGLRVDNLLDGCCLLTVWTPYYSTA